VDELKRLGAAMTYDDPFVVRTNINRLQSRLFTESDEPTRHIVRQLLAEFEAAAVKMNGSGRGALDKV
jgi:hypothetical protein